VAYEIIYWSLLRGLLSGTSGSFLSADPQWAVIIGHLMFGAVLGLRWITHTGLRTASFPQ